MIQDLGFSTGTCSSRAAYINSSINEWIQPKVALYFGQHSYLDETVLGFDFTRPKTLTPTMPQVPHKARASSCTHPNVT